MSLGTWVTVILHSRAPWGELLVVAKCPFKKDILKIAAAVEDSDYVHAVSFEPIEDAIGRYDQLTKEADPESAEFRHDSATIGKAFQTVRTSFELVKELFGVVGVVSRDMLDESHDIVHRNGRPPNPITFRHAGFVF